MKSKLEISGHEVTELELTIQNYVDGELRLEDRRSFELQMATQPELSRRVAEIREFAKELRRAEPSYSVPASREFYFSQIRRRLASETQKAERDVQTRRSEPNWWQWLVPIAGAAVLALTFAATRLGSERRDLGKSDLEMAGVESLQSENSATVFRSDSDGVTIHWIN